MEGVSAACLEALTSGARVQHRHGRSQSGDSNQLRRDASTGRIAQFRCCNAPQANIDGLGLHVQTVEGVGGELPKSSSKRGLV